MLESIVECLHVLMTCITYGLPRVFVSGKPFHHRVMFAGKARRGEHLLGYAPGLLSNITPARKMLANILVYL
jgi:hypothetical protein